MRRLICIIDQLADHGCVALYKADGQRSRHKRTVVISFDDHDGFHLDFDDDGEAIAKIFDWVKKVRPSLLETLNSAQQGDAPEPGSIVAPASRRQPPRPGDQ